MLKPRNPALALALILARQTTSAPRPCQYTVLPFLSVVPQHAPWAKRHTKTVPSDQPNPSRSPCRCAAGPRRSCASGPPLGSRVRASSFSSDTAAFRSSSTCGSMVAAMPLELPFCAPGIAVVTDRGAHTYSHDMRAFSTGEQQRLRLPAKRTQRHCPVERSLWPRAQLGERASIDLDPTNDMSMCSSSWKMRQHRRGYVRSGRLTRPRRETFERLSRLALGVFSAAAAA